MPHAAQNVALASESLLASFSHPRNIEKLHCYAPLKPSIIAFCQPDAAHATVADLRHQCVKTESLTPRARPPRQFNAALLQEMFLGQHAVFLKKYFQLIRQCWVRRAQAGQPDGAFFFCHAEQLVQVWTEDLPLIGDEPEHLFLR